MPDQVTDSQTMPAASAEDDEPHNPAACEHEPAHAELDELDVMVTHLAGTLAAETPTLTGDRVTGIVRETFAQLARTAKLTNYLLPLTERFARERIADLTRGRDRS